MQPGNRGRNEKGEYGWPTMSPQGRKAVEYEGQEKQQDKQRIVYLGNMKENLCVVKND